MEQGGDLALQGWGRRCQQDRRCPRVRCSVFRPRLPPIGSPQHMRSSARMGWPPPPKRSPGRSGRRSPWDPSGITSAHQVAAGARPPNRLVAVHSALAAHGVAATDVAAGAHRVTTAGAGRRSPWEAANHGIAAAQKGPPQPAGSPPPMRSLRHTGSPSIAGLLEHIGWFGPMGLLRPTPSPQHMCSFGSPTLINNAAAHGNYCGLLGMRVPQPMSLRPHISELRIASGGRGTAALLLTCMASHEILRHLGVADCQGRKILCILGCSTAGPTIFGDAIRLAHADRSWLPGPISVPRILGALRLCPLGQVLGLALHRFGGDRHPDSCIWPSDDPVGSQNQDLMIRSPTPQP